MVKVGLRRAVIRSDFYIEFGTFHETIRYYSTSIVLIAFYCMV